MFTKTKLSKLRFYGGLLCLLSNTQQLYADSWLSFLSCGCYDEVDTAGRHNNRNARLPQNRLVQPPDFRVDHQRVIQHNNVNNQNDSLVSMIPLTGSIIGESECYKYGSSFY